MIYDCFCFFNEIEILEMRLNILNPVVDRFVLVESAWTHTGKPKPFFFEKNKRRYSDFLNKIIHIKLTERPAPPDNLTSDESRWFLENYQRNALVRGLSEAKPDDVIMVSDCDEIPDPKIVGKLPRSNAIAHFNPRNYAFYLNLRNYRNPFSGVGTTALKYRRFVDPVTYARFPFAGYVAKVNNPTPTMTQIRFLSPTRRYYCGWHLSYMGGAEAVHRKFNSTADGDMGGCDKLSVEETAKMLRESHSLFGPDYPFFVEPIQLHLPKYLIENQDRYQSFFLPISPITFKTTRFIRIRTLLREFIKTFNDQYFIPYAASVKYAFCRAQSQRRKTFLRA